MIAFYLLLVFIVSCQSEDDTATFSSFIFPNASLTNSIQSTLSDDIGFIYGIPCSNRTEWDTRKRTIDPNAVRTGVTLLGTPQPAWSDTLYLQYQSTGSTAGGQSMMVNRNMRLFPMALAECLYWNGTFAAQLNEELLSIANQPTWVWPGENYIEKIYNTYLYVGGFLDSFYGKGHHVELGASYTAGTIGVILGLLDTAINPDVAALLKQRLSERITQPVLNSIANVFPNGTNPTKNFWMNANSNWNSVCWGATVISASISLDDKAKRATIYSNAFVNGNDYLNVFTSDGWDTEGVMYWNMGFGEYITLRESILRVTQNTFDLLNNPFASISSRFPLEAALFSKNGDWYGPDFGDCPPESTIINGNLRDYLDLALGNARQQGNTIDQPTNRPPGIVIGLFSDINPVVVLPSSSLSPKYTSNSLRSYFSEEGILISRSFTNSTPSGLSAAFKLLGNEGIHSHNDIGSYEIFLNGLKITGEPGGVNYTVNSFGKNRFISEFFNSIGHPVPKVNDQQQIIASTRTFNIKNNPKEPFSESAIFTNNQDSIVFDLTAAYNVSSLISLKRFITFSRKAGDSFVSIEDKFSFSSPSTFETALIAPSGWDLNTNLFWNTAAPNSQLLLSTFSSLNTSFSLSSTTISSSEYKRSIQRIALGTTGRVTLGSIGYKLIPQFKCLNTQFYDSAIDKCKTCSNGVPLYDASKCVCNGGYYWNATQKACVQCEANQFSLAGSESCKVCRFGSTSSLGSSYCNAKAGAYWNLTSNSILPCTENTFSLPGAFECTFCPSGSTSTTFKQSCICGDGFVFNNVKATCDACKPGTFALSGSGSCRVCPAGSYSLAGAVSCTKCPPGTSTNAQTGSAECIPCVSGTSTNGIAGFSACQPCAAGRYAPFGSPSCMTCDAGTYSLPGSGECTQCASGSSTNGRTGSINCTLCAAGSFASKGSSTCTKCNSGTFSSSVGSSSCTQCKQNEYSISGQSTCRTCPNGSNSDLSNTICPCLDTQFFSTYAATCYRCGNGAFCNCPSGQTWSGKTSTCI